MPEFLTFALAAPFGAMGAVAVGERREGWSRPARSAVLGLAAACLGLRRDEEAAHAALEAGLGLALLVEAPGRLLQDYHTAQVPPQRRNRRFRTRTAELAVPKWELNTVLTRREYRQDMLCLAALWVRPGAAHALEDVAAGMRTPRFVPYLGRKSCPLGLKLAPVLAMAADPVAALADRRAHGPENALRTGHDIWLPPLAETPVVALDATDAEAFWPGEVRRDWRREWRRDAVASRRRWQFALREEAIVPLPAHPSAPEAGPGLRAGAAP